MDEGNFKDALIHAQKSVSFFPNEGNSINLASIYGSLGDYKKAQDIYREAFHEGMYIHTTHKHYEQLYSSYATFLVFNNEPQMAVKIVDQGLKDYPSSTTLWLPLTLAKYRLNEHAGALAAATKAYELNPNDPNTIQVYMRLSNNLPLTFINN